MHVEFRVLGPLEVRRGGEVVPLKGQKIRALLADLLLHRGDVVPVDRLVDDLWPAGPPKGAQHALEAHASKLRAALGGAATLTARPPGYVLELDPSSLDAVRFERLLDEARDARAMDPARAAARAAEALALWRGAALADVAYEPFAQAEIARLEELRLEAEEERMDAELALGRSTDVLGELEAFVAAQPLRERRRSQLMLALYRAGRQADALATFREAREQLLDELGLEPSPALRGLERAILQQDEALAGGVVPVAASRMELRLVTVVAVEPEISLDLDPEEHDRETRRAAETVDVVAREYAADRPEPFLLAFAQEDHAERATAAARALRETVHGGVGIASGEALLGNRGIGGAVVARARAQARDAGDEAPVPPSAPERRADGPFVNRTAELARLRNARAAVVVGPPGIGKSRLAQEVARERPAAFGRCSSYGADSLAPLHEIAAAVGAPHALANLRAEEVPSTLRRLCENVLVVVDDVQWADQLVVETVEHLAAQAVPVLCLGREEVLEERPSFLAGAERVVLEPLPPEEAEALATQLAPIDARVLERALATAEGNPLFIEQLLAHASEGDGPIPRTLQSLLAARLDRLAPSERRAIEHAAVIGREFDAALVAELLDAGAARQPLAALARRGLIEPEAPTESFEERFRFHHVLIREAAYAASPKAERARLHERLADILDGRGDGDEVVGFHLACAAELRPERDRHARRLAEDAGRRLAAAGMSSWRLGHAARTSALLGRAVDLLEHDDEQRRELLCELGVARNTAGETAAADEALQEAVEVAVQRGDRRIELRARIELAAVHLLDDSQQRAEELVSLAADAIPLFEGLGDDRSLGRAWMLTGWVQGGLYCRNETWGECAARALVHYRRAGLPSSTCVGQIAAAAYFGPLPSSDGVERCRELLDREVDDRAGEASVLAHLGGLEAMLGRFDDAQARLASARAIYHDLARPTAVARTCAPIEAAVHRLMGDDERARATLVESCSMLEEMRNWTHFVSQAAALADVLCALGDDGAARQWLQAAEAHERRDDTFARLDLGAPRAKLLARAGNDDDANTVASETVALAETTDGLNQHAAALLALAEVHELAGRSEEARSAAARARALYDEKENVAASALLETDAATRGRDIG